MKKLLAFLLAISISSPAHAGFGGKDGGLGVTVAFYDSPTSTTSLCSGTAIAPKIVITAGHCTHMPDILYVGLPDMPTTYTDGRVSAEKRTLKYLHLPNKDPEYDVGIVYLSKPLKVKTLRIATLSHIRSWVKEGKEVFVIGYGFNAYTNKWTTNKPQIFQGKIRSYRNTFTEIEFKPPVGICGGDSGGSVLTYHKGYLYYIGNISSSHNNACDPDFPWNNTEYYNAIVYNWTYYKNKIGDLP